MSNDAADALEYVSRYIGDPPHPIEESLKTIVESEGVRVYVCRNPNRQCVEVQTCLVRESYFDYFDITDAAIEAAETGAMVQHVVERVRSCAREMRSRVVNQMLLKGIDLNNENVRAATVAAIVSKASESDIEQLAIELMAHVERLGK